MATIEKKPIKGGSFSYRIMIRKKNQNIYKSFDNEEDAKLYVFYKERLIDNIESFDVDLKDRVTLKQIIELKSKNVESERYRSDLINAFAYIERFINVNKFLNEISYDNWLDCAKKLLDVDVYQGVKTEETKRKMSISSLRRNFAVMSASFSYSIEKGINLENHPMKVLASFINPKMPKKE